MKLSKLFGAAALGAFVLASASASALTLRITDLGADGVVGGGDDVGITVEDNLAGDNIGVTGIISFSSAVSGLVGGFTLSLTSTVSTDADGVSRLTLTESTVTGAGTLLIEASDTGFGEGAFAPTASALAFTANAADVGNEITFSGFVDDGDNLFGTGDITIASGTVDDPTDDVAGVTGSVLTDPFSITITALLDHTVGGLKTTSSFDSNVTATVPVPAPLALLITAIAGLGFAARRRRATA